MNATTAKAPKANGRKPADTPPDVGPQIVFRPLDSLIPYARNARTHSAEQVAQLAASLVEFGFTNPVLADATGIVAGHGRVLAARQVYDAGQRLRLPSGQQVPAGEIPVLDCTGWSEAQRRAYILADNKLALNAGWDSALLLLELDDLKSEGIDTALAGFSPGEIETMRAGWEADFAAIDKTLAAASRCSIRVTAPAECEAALRKCIEDAIAANGFADVDVE